MAEFQSISNVNSLMISINRILNDILLLYFKDVFQT